MDSLIRTACCYEGDTWTPKVCKIMAFMAIIRDLGLLFYILLGFRYGGLHMAKGLETFHI